MNWDPRPPTLVGTLSPADRRKRLILDPGPRTLSAAGASAELRNGTGGGYPETWPPPLQNADMVTIAHSLVRDPALRQALVPAAEGPAKRQPPAVGDEPLKIIKESQGQLWALGLPLGWDTADPRTWPGTDWRAWAMKALGLLLTALAVSLGAPFWFDVLNKFMVARSTVKPE
jgi:hypothetical protein